MEKVANNGRKVKAIALLFKLTPNIIFGMCNIWVILRRNVMYLYSKNLILINLFTVKVPDMMSLGEFLVQKTKEN